MKLNQQQKWQHILSIFSLSHTPYVRQERRESERDVYRRWSSVNVIDNHKQANYRCLKLKRRLRGGDKKRVGVHSCRVSGARERPGAGGLRLRHSHAALHAFFDTCLACACHLAHLRITDSLDAPMKSHVTNLRLPSQITSVLCKSYLRHAVRHRRVWLLV